MAAHRFLESYRLAPVVTVMSEQGGEGEVEKERKGAEEEKRGTEEKGDVGEDGLNVSTTGEGNVVMCFIVYGQCYISRGCRSSGWWIM